MLLVRTTLPIIKSSAGVIITSIVEKLFSLNLSGMRNSDYRGCTIFIVKGLTIPKGDSLKTVLLSK